MPPPGPAVVAAEITAALEAEADPAKQQWWERYLKGAVPFLGVPMARVRAIVAGSWRTNELSSLDSEQVLDLATHLMALPRTEEKLAGILLLAEHGLELLTSADEPRLAAPLGDWYCVKVLGPLVGAQSDQEHLARRIANWTQAPVLWQRRAGVVAFVNLVPAEPELFPGFRDLVIEACDRNAQDPQRWSQTSVGWVLREMSKADPDRVQRFVAAHPQLSREAQRAATARL